MTRLALLRSGKSLNVLSVAFSLRKNLLFCALLFTCAFVKAQAPVIKVDMDQTGRPLAEVNEPGYTSWQVKSGLADSITVSGVKIKLKLYGNTGTGIQSDWYKAGIQAPYYARLVSDVVTVTNGNAGGQMEMRITGLPAGKHTLLTYHNTVVSPATGTFSPIDIYLNDSLVVNDLIPSNRVLTTAEAPIAYIGFAAEDNKDVVFRFSAETNTTATLKNVVVNAFEINTSNAAYLAKNPFPTDRDEHVDADNGTLRMAWTKAAAAASHDIYIGTSLADVTAATHASPAFKGNQTDTFFNVSGQYSMNTYYWRIDEVTTGGNVTKGNVWYYRPRQLAFKGAEGYGRFARGGRGGKVVEVTNLNDAGPGSFREAVESNIGPRTIVFAVSGLITLNSRVTLSSPYITIAGQTAPGKGIAFRKAPVGIAGNDNVLRFVRVRLGKGYTYEGIGVTGADNVIVDHCSIAWTIDEAFSSRNAKNITLQRTMIAEPLNAAGHVNYPVGTEHGYAGSIGGDVGSFHHNLLVHSYGRNWSLAGGLDGNGNFAGRMDITNNVVYNWYQRTTDGGAHEVNFVNNYYKRGPAWNGSSVYALNAQYDNFPGYQKYYFAGNKMPGVFDETNQTAGRTYSGTPQGYSPWVSTPFFPSYVTTQTADEAYKSVLSDVGHNLPFDDHDVRMIDETLRGTFKYRGSYTNKAGLPDDENDVGGWEAYPEVHRPANWDSDHDGLPDWWETLKGLNPNSAAGDFSDANADADMDGFTNLDDYLEWISVPNYTVASNQQLSINLKQFSRGYASNPSFTLSNIVNGQVTIVNDSLAQFVSVGNGFASFKFTVTDAAGSAMTRLVNVGVTPASPSPLPVTLYSFEAVRKNAKLVEVTWKTATEENNDYFEVQRAPGATGPFVSVAKVNTKATNGTGSSELTYQFSDANNATDKTFYRLVQKDKDGKATLSETRMVKGIPNSPTFRVWPVPNNGNFHVSAGNIAEAATLLVYNAEGKEVLKRLLNSNGIADVQIPVAGTYFLKVVNQKNEVLFKEKIVAGQ